MNETYEARHGSVVVGWEEKGEEGRLWNEQNAFQAVQ